MSGRPLFSSVVAAAVVLYVSAENSIEGTTQNDHIDANTGQLLIGCPVLSVHLKKCEIYKIPIFEREVLKLKIAPNLLNSRKKFFSNQPIASDSANSENP